MTTVQEVAKARGDSRSRHRAVARKSGGLLDACLAWLSWCGRALRASYYRALGREDPAWLADLRSRVRRFYDDFEQLVDLICAAARVGVVGGMALEYKTLRLAMLRSYVHLKPYVLAFVDVEVADAEYGLRTCGRALDALECLFLAPDLETLLASDDGRTRGRIERSREALYRLTDYLCETGR